RNRTAAPGLVADSGKRRPDRRVPHATDGHCVARAHRRVRERRWCAAGAGGLPAAGDGVAPRDWRRTRTAGTTAPDGNGAALRAWRSGGAATGPGDGGGPSLALTNSAVSCPPRALSRR